MAKTKYTIYVLTNSRTYSAVLKLLDKNFDDISEDDIVEIHE